MKIDHNKLEHTAPRAPYYIDVVEGLRGIASLIVVVYHCFTHSNSPEWRPFLKLNVLRIFHDGWCGVNLFLILSGFCLFWPYAKNEARKLSYPNFMYKRAWRIVPAYYASLVLVPLSFWLPTQLGFRVGSVPLMPSSGIDIATHLVLFHSFSANAFRSWNGVTWSLGLEWTWYLFFPVAVWLFRRWGPYRTVLLCSAISLAYCCGVYWVLGPTNVVEENLAFTVRSFLLARLFEFTFGMLIAWWLANRRFSYVQVMFALASIFPFLLFAHLTTPVDPVLPVRNALYGTAFSAMLLAAVSGVPNPITWLCRLPWLQRIGLWSYSLYLFHLPVVVLVTSKLATHGINGPLRFLLSLLSLAIVIPLAKLQYLAFERPFFTARQKRDHPRDILPEPTSA